jgi:hypothetical protein
MPEHEIDLCIEDLKLTLQYLINRVKHDSSHKAVDAPWVEKAERLLDLLEGK